MLKELLNAELICENHLINKYGANAYDCTSKGDALLKKSKAESVKEITDLVASAAGHFTGAFISEASNS